MRRRGRRVARLPAVMPRPASTLDQMAIWYVASIMTGLVRFLHVLVYYLERVRDIQRKSGS